MAEQLTGEVTELLQELIRNQCVNDGTPESGEEARNADMLQAYLEGTGLDVERFEPMPGRGSLVARIEGSDPAAPSLCLMGHTDVVPVNAERLVARPVRRRARRRRGVGPRRDRHAQPHGVDGGGLPSISPAAGSGPKGDADLLRRRRRGGGRRTGRGVDAPITSATRSRPTTC